MKTLAISCAGSTTGVAISEAGRPLGEVLIAGDFRAGEKIPGLIEKLLAQLSLSIQQVDRVAVTAGPGSYSGLRSAMAAAKAISQARELPILGVSSLEAAAFGFRGRSVVPRQRPLEVPVEGGLPGVVAAILLHAVKDNWNIALFSLSGSSRITDDFVITEAALTQWRKAVEGRVTFVETSGPAPSDVALLAEEKFASGQKDDPITLAPRYSHEPTYRKFDMIRS